MKHLNFIPFDLRPQVQLPGQWIPMSLALFLVLNVGGSVAWNWICAHRAQAEWTRIESANQELTQKMGKISGSQNRQKLDDAVAKMQVVLDKKNYWSGVFKEISSIIPEGIWLTGISDVQAASKSKTATKEPELLYIRGESSSPNGIAKFLATLEKSHHFSGAQIRFAERELDVQPLRYKFEFSVPMKTLKNEGG